jgi:hypothetical protein
MKREAAVIVGLVLLGVAGTWGHWGHPQRWQPDALFYETQMLELRGVDHSVALRRVFDGPLAAQTRAADAIVADGAWRAYSSRFYRRRWLAPALAAAVEPLFGTGSLQIVSLSAYLLIGPLLYLLLRRRFSLPVSGVAAAVCAALPSLRYWAEQPLSDVPAVAVETLALLAAALALERRRPWLLLWMASVAMLAFARDSTFVLVVAAAWVVLRRRTRRALALLAGGVLAALPAPLLFGAPLRTALAYTFSNSTIPTDTSWGFIARQYPHFLQRTASEDFQYLTRHTPLTGVVVVVALAGLLAFRRRGDWFPSLARAGAVGCLAYVLVLPNPTGLRLELVFVPVVGIGLAMAFAKASAPDAWPRRTAGARLRRALPERAARG